MTEANITIEEISSHLKVAHVSGQLDESNIDEKIQAVYKTIEETPIHLGLIFDLAELDYMNSKSIGYMTDIYGKITENGGKVVIAAAKANIADILDVVGLTQLINIYDNIELAKLKVNEALPKENIPGQVATTATPQKEQAPQTTQTQPATTTQPQATQAVVNQTTNTQPIQTMEDTELQSVKPISQPQASPETTTLQTQAIPETTPQPISNPQVTPAPTAPINQGQTEEKVNKIQL